MQTLTTIVPNTGHFHKEFTLKKEGESLRWHLVFKKEAPEKADIAVHLKGRKSTIELWCAYEGTATMHTDITLNIFHDAPETVSRVHFKATLDDASKIACIGTVHIGKKADKSDALLSARALLLSEKAMARIKPDLEIETDDVKARHGSSIGSISAHELFYFASRGISERESKKMIAEGFLRDVIA